MFAGDLVVVTQVQALQPVIDRARSLLCAAFSTTDLELAQDKLGGEEFVARIVAVRLAFRDDSPARVLVEPVAAALGLDAARTYSDRLSLRVVPSDATPQHTADPALGAHRDTWSSNAYPQVNWWFPLVDLTAERTVCFYPRHWTTPIPDTSGDRDLDQLRAVRRSGAAATVPLVPAPVAPPDPADELRIVVEPGDLLLFSGAHLHATVPNSSRSPRYSVRGAHRGARRRARWPGSTQRRRRRTRGCWEWFRRIDDGTALSDVLAPG